MSIFIVTHINGLVFEIFYSVFCNYTNRLPKNAYNLRLSHSKV